jgi:hypothetical protein
MQVVHLRINDSATGKPTPVRLRLAGPDGRYLPPLGRPADVPTGPGEDVGGSVRLDERTHAYIDGTCEALLPAGPIHLEVHKGGEYEPLRQTWERKLGQITLRLSLARRFDPGAEGWYAGDTHVRFLSPRAAALEGAAEGLQVVNVLAAEWQAGAGRSALSNLLEFSGQQPALVRDGCLVAVNTLNRSDTLGDLALLNSHRVVFPLSLSWPGFEKWTLQDWCRQCHRKGGLVVWPSFGSPGGTRLADLVLGDIDAVEWASTCPFAAADWYRCLNAGFRVPLAGGSGKVDNATCAGAVRTYAQLPPGQPLDYPSWIEAVRLGRTFATRGPLLSLTVNGQGPGATFPVDDESAPFQVEAAVRSIAPFDRLELVLNGEVIGTAAARPDLTAGLTLARPVHTTAWLAARCLGTDGLLAHTSPIYFRRPGQPVVDPEALLLLRQQLVQLQQWTETGIAEPDRRQHLMTTIADALGCPGR